MPRIRLAHWHDGHLPGDEIEVDAEQLRGMQRDGRVAAVLGYDAGGMLTPTAVEAVGTADTPEPVAVPPKRARKPDPEPT